MRINHNIQALNAYKNLSTNQMNTSKSLEKLSSGLRINRAADDAAGLAISEKMRSQIRALDMAERNALDGISLIQTAEGGMQEVHSMLQRMRELAVQSSNGTYQDTEDRAYLDAEVQQLKQEIDRIAQTTQFNGTNLLDGKTTNIQFQISPEAPSLALKLAKIGDVTTATLGLTTTSITTATNATTAITQLDKAIAAVSKDRSTLGAAQNRLEHAMSNISTMSENLTASESRIRDVDMAQEMTEFTKNNILNQAAQAMLAQANQLPQGILQLLK
ncbi:flagellin [Priestia flexa]|uniref:Flagellin n=1 Tax=Priestia flexa TaxID=86664 RepID=A0ABU4J360_9BACI|nr:MULTISPECIES: flagellin [Bacillaceae]AQX53213.1 flagellin [Priestia flexa]KZB90003.1 flagellin [Bacillus sp. VT 712]MBY6088482.1 flagellin [Priestia flexa]MCA1202374.1 flagellin [Priestia flexa]MCG7313504.1 flagellin [Priestia flexa]